MKEITVRTKNISEIFPDFPFMGIREKREKNENDVQRRRHFGFVRPEDPPFLLVVWRTKLITQ